MAKIRTSVTLISFGFTISKFLQSLRDGDILREGSTIASGRLDLWLIIIGKVYLILSTIRHLFIFRDHKVENMKKRFSCTFYLALIIVAQV